MKIDMPSRVLRASEKRLRQLKAFCRENGRGFSVSVVCLAPLMVFGCASRSSADLSEIWHHEKVVATHHLIETLVDHTIKQEGRLSRKPKQLNFEVFIEPQISAGYARRAEGGVNFFGNGVSGNVSITISSETINQATRAIVTVAILSPGCELRTTSELFLWERGRWVSEMDIGLRWYDSHDPNVAARLRQLMID